MPNPECLKCKGEGFFLLYNFLTGNTLKIPCLCIPLSKEEIDTLAKTNPRFYSALLDEV